MIGLEAVDCAPVAQLDRASAFEAEGRGFDSLQARHFFRCSSSIFSEASPLDGPLRSANEKIVRMESIGDCTVRLSGAKMEIPG